MTQGAVSAALKTAFITPRLKKPGMDYYYLKSRDYSDTITQKTLQGHFTVNIEM